MPSRHHVLFILAFWIATSSWLFYRDLLPRFRQGEPPPFAIDLADEAEAHLIRWSVKRPDGTRVGYAETAVRYIEDSDTFEVSGVFKFWTLSSMVNKANQEVDSKYFVTREGEVRHIDATVTLRILNNDESAITARLSGDVKDHVFTPILEIPDLPEGLLPHLQPVPVSSQGSVLNPLQPLNRISGLKPGQEWRMPLVDPLADALAALNPLRPKTMNTSFLDARVLSQTQELDQRTGPALCLVIEYTGDDITARTWVRQADGLVLRQEVTQHGESLVLQRD